MVQFYMNLLFLNKLYIYIFQNKNWGCTQLVHPEAQPLTERLSSN